MNVFLRYWRNSGFCAQTVALLPVRLPQRAIFSSPKVKPGRPGGRLIVAERSEPKTLNPVTALDGPSRDVIRRMTADLIRINRSTQLTEPALAISWIRFSRQASIHAEAAARNQVFRRPSL